MSNPTTYDASDGAIVLENLHRDGYVFVGWAGTDLAEPQETVTIHMGSTGDRSYTAVWEAFAPEPEPEPAEEPATEPAKTAAKAAVPAPATTPAPAEAVPKTGDPDLGSPVAALALAGGAAALIGRFLSRRREP